jgi:hypothetical protein
VTFDVGALGTELRACVPCVKRHGREALKNEGNRLLVLAHSKPDEKRFRSTCGHCGNLKPTDQLLCDDCERERRQLFA